MAGELTIVPLKLQTYNNSSGGSKGWFSKSKYTRTASQVRVHGSAASAGDDLTLRSTNKNVTIRAAKLTAGGDITLAANNGRVALLVDKEPDYLQEKRDSESLVWWKKTDKGHYTENVIHNHLIAGGAIKIRAANGVIVEYKETGNVRQSIAQLSKISGLEWMAQVANRDDVSWRAVQAEAEKWNHKDEGLTQAAAAIIAIAVTLATQGAASGIAASMSAAIVGATGAAATATTAAVQLALTKAIAAGLTTIASRAAVSLINNKGDLGAVLRELGSSDFIRSLATSMITAGLISGLDSTVLSDASLGLASNRKCRHAENGPHAVTKQTQAPWELPIFTI